MGVETVQGRLILRIAFIAPETVIAIERPEQAGAFPVVRTTGLILPEPGYGLQGGPEETDPYRGSRLHPVVFEGPALNVRLPDMGEVDEGHPAQLIAEAGRILCPAEGFRPRILEQQGLYVLSGQGFLMPDVYARVYVLEEPPDIRGMAVVHAFVVDAPEHAQVGGYRIRELPAVGEPLLVRFEVVTVDVREGCRGLSEEERVGVQGVLIQAGRRVATVLS